MSPRSKVIIGLASAVIFVLAAAVEIRRGLRERDEEIRYVTEWIKSETARAEELRQQGSNSFTPESHVTYGQSRLSDLREVSRPIIQGLLRGFFDLCVLLPIGLVSCYAVAAVARHPVQPTLGKIVVRLGLPVLCVSVVLFLIWIVLVGLTLGPLAVPAG
jgi:hypothetical protein